MLNDTAEMAIILEILSANEELTRDLISIITSFSARLYGLRSHKMKDILEAVKE